MKLVKEVKRIEVCEGIKKGDILELENTLSCDKQVVKIIEINNEGLKVIKLQNGQTETYTYDGLTNYEAKRMKLVYDTDKSILSQAAQTDLKGKINLNKEPIKADYSESILRALKDAFGENFRLV